MNDFDMNLRDAQPSTGETQICGESECCASVEECILEDMSSSIQNGTNDYYVVTITDYLSGAVNIDVPKEAIVSILIDRDIDGSMAVSDVDKDIRKLCKADLYVWVAMGVSRKGSVSDSDNGWSHTDGGYTLSDDARNLLLREANAIYEEMGEEPVGKTKVRIRSNGIMMSGIVHCGIRTKRALR